MWIIKKKNELDPQLGIYDMRSYIPMDAPEQLKKLVGRNIAMKGGGGQTQTTTSSVPSWAAPHLKNVFGDVTKRYENITQPTLEDGSPNPDYIDPVAGFTPEQTQAMDAQKLQAEQAMAGTGAYDYTGALNRDIQNAVGTAAGQAALGGQAGSARAQKMMASVAGDKSLQYQKMRQQDMGQGANMLAGVGQQQQQMNQAVLDAPDVAAKNYFGYVHGTGSDQTTTRTGGGK